MKQVILIAFLVSLCVGIFLYVYTADVANAPHAEDREQSATTTEVETVEPASEILPYGKTALRVGAWGVFSDVRIRPVRIVEDSRCPRDVTCIQAGTVRVELETVSGLGTSTDVLAIGEMRTTEAEVVTFVGASPEALASHPLSFDAYTLTFAVEKREPAQLPKPDVPPGATGACYVGGCSSQLCSSTPDMASTCEYREEYACYAHATCERQSNGQCGWTPTPTFNSCMQDASRSVYPQ